jgi:hypothetical protein
MTLEEIVEYQAEESIRGELAREFVGILSDYQTGALTIEDKNLMITEILNSCQSSELAQDEVIMRWAVSAATTAVNII